MKHVLKRDLASESDRLLPRSVISYALFALLAVAALLPATVTRADLHWTDDNPVSPWQPKEKSKKPADGFNWVNPPYTHSGAVPNGTTIGKLARRLFGRDNEFDKDKIKRVTIELDYVGGLPEVGGFIMQGAHKAHKYYGGWKHPKISYTDVNSHILAIWDIIPQPDWEVFEIRNRSKTQAMVINNFTMTHKCREEGETTWTCMHCIPAPGGACIMCLMVGAVTSRRRETIPRA
jgi:hypothetical protein